jgi:hypothetical protein
MGIPVIDTILNVIKTPLERLIPDKNKKAEFEHALQIEVLKAGLGQMEINKVEAAHKSIFVAGWRPFIGWVCGFALAWHFILYDIAQWMQLSFFPDSPQLPALNGTETLITVLLSMLGLGGLRTFEKIKGVARDGIRRKDKE